jgi:hypothetical protein
MISIAKAYALRALIEKASASLSDTDALEAVELFEPWQTDTAYTADTRIRYNGKLYRVVQSHTSQSDWTPDITPALYTEVKEQGQGTKDNPIPYNGNMALEQGLYYTQDGVKYLCIRDTVNPVYNALADLVGLYVEIVE